MHVWVHPCILPPCLQTTVSASWVGFLLLPWPLPPTKGPITLEPRLQALSRSAFCSQGDTRHITAAESPPGGSGLNHCAQHSRPFALQLPLMLQPLPRALSDPVWHPRMHRDISLVDSESTYCLSSLRSLPFMVFPAQLTRPSSTWLPLPINGQRPGE